MENYPGIQPFFNAARGWADATLVITPPFSFPGVTARVFPLRASMNILSSFCRSYLNVAPAEICELRPYLPYVFLVILDYGRMAIETANLGWVSQHEVFFAVPLERWHRGRGGRMVFDGWVLSTPFIFVDNAASLTTGREVYGWPKVLATLRPSLEEWLVDPRRPTRFLSLSVSGFSSRDAGKVPLLEIDQRPGAEPLLRPLRPHAGRSPRAALPLHPQRLADRGRSRGRSSCAPRSPASDRPWQTPKATPRSSSGACGSSAASCGGREWTW